MNKYFKYKSKYIEKQDILEKLKDVEKELNSTTGPSVEVLRKLQDIHYQVQKMKEIIINKQH